ncbi:MAG: hypothetical protein KAR25_04260, partial [Methanosarcinales archaeon]|nr:hypothetical protein [Methanosarcinales archaeon]
RVSFSLVFPCFINVLGLEHQSIIGEVYSSVFILKGAYCSGSLWARPYHPETGKSSVSQLAEPSAKTLLMKDHV